MPPREGSAGTARLTMDLVGTRESLSKLDSTKQRILQDLTEQFFEGEMFATRTRFLCVNDDPVDGALRALKYSRFDLKKAIIYIENNLEWRAANNVDQILSRSSLSKEQLSLIRTAFGDGFHGRDLQGFPIYWCPVGSIDFSELKAAVSLEGLVEYHLQMMEFNQQVYLRDFCTETQTFHSFTCVVDLKGLSPSQLSRALRECLSAVSTLDRDFYHDNFHRVIIINAPFVARLFWKTASSFFRQETKMKFQFLEKAEDLFKFVGSEVTPQRFGGRVPDADILYGSFGEGKCLTAYTQRMDAHMAASRQ